MRPPMCKPNPLSLLNEKLELEVRFELSLSTLPHVGSLYSPYSVPSSLQDERERFLDAMERSQEEAEKIIEQESESSMSSTEMFPRSFPFGVKNIDKRGFYKWTNVDLARRTTKRLLKYEDSLSKLIVSVTSLQRGKRRYSQDGTLEYMKIMMELEKEIYSYLHLVFRTPHIPLRLANLGSYKTHLLSEIGNNRRPFTFYPIFLTLGTEHDNEKTKTFCTNIGSFLKYSDVEIKFLDSLVGKFAGIEDEIKDIVSRGYLFPVFYIDVSDFHFFSLRIPSSLKDIIISFISGQDFD
jgi:hypothetical protein